MPDKSPPEQQVPDQLLSMLGPDFPFSYDAYVRHPAGLGSVPPSRYGTEVAVVGAGCAGVVAAYELMKLGLRPVVYEADQIGGRMRTVPFASGGFAELGAMRFPPTSTTLFEYFNRVGLQTFPFPNPLAACTPSTVVDLKGTSHYARTLHDLPPEFTEVATAWRRTLEDSADLHAIQAAIRDRDIVALKAAWDPLVHALDDETFWGFLSKSPHFTSFTHREMFGKVGFGTGGWDTDYPSSMLEVLRVVLTGADEDHRGIAGGSQQFPRRLWQRSPEHLTHWPIDTSLASLHESGPHPAVTAIGRDSHHRYLVTDASGRRRRFESVVVTAQSWMLLTNISCDDDLFPAPVWSAIEQTHYMGSSKVFVAVDRPFWNDKDPSGRDVMSMTLTDRMTRSTYLFDFSAGTEFAGTGGAVICLSYTWEDDSRKIAPLSADERVDLMLKSLRAIYPDVDIRSHIVGPPISVSWEAERNFMGAFKANLPGHYRYQEALYTHFMQQNLAPRHRGIFLAGDDISWTAGWAEGAVTTALNAVWGVMHQLGGATPPENPGPGDVFYQIAPVKLTDSIWPGD